MAEEKGLLPSLLETGGGITEAALASGLPASIVRKNPLTVLAEQSTALTAVVGLGIIGTVSVIGLILSCQDDESCEPPPPTENPQPNNIPIMSRRDRQTNFVANTFTR